MRTDGMPGTIKESKPREESERKHLKRIVSSFVEDEMINYEPGDNLKFQVMDYDKKGHCTHVPTKQFCKQPSIRAMLADSPLTHLEHGFVPVCP